MRKNSFPLLISILMPYLILGVLFWQMAYPYFHGTEILFKAEHYDPRDIFRGQYLELKYEFTFYDLSQRKFLLKKKEYFPQDILYLILEKGPDNFYQAKLLQDEKPSEGLFLRVMPRYGFELPSGVENPAISIELVAGIENYFINFNEIPNFEQNQKFFVKVSLAPNGIARIKDLGFEK